MKTRPVVVRSRIWIAALGLVVGCSSATPAPPSGHDAGGSDAERSGSGSGSRRKDAGLDSGEDARRSSGSGSGSSTGTGLGSSFDSGSDSPEADAAPLGACTCPGEGGCSSTIMCAAGTGQCVNGTCVGISCSENAGCASGSCSRDTCQPKGTPSGCMQVLAISMVVEVGGATSCANACGVGWYAFSCSTATLGTNVEFTPVCCPGDGGTPSFPDGGPPACSPLCPDGTTCETAGDCASGSCTHGRCTPPACAPCGDGEMCGAAGDCASGVCTDGVCSAAPGH